jgi:hypothetical protein
MIWRAEEAATNIEDSFFIKQAVLRSVRGLFQSELPIEFDLVIPLAISSIFTFPQGHAIPAYVFSLVFPSLLCII